MRYQGGKGGPSRKQERAAIGMKMVYVESFSDWGDINLQWKNKGRSSEVGEMVEKGENS